MKQLVNELSLWIHWGNQDRKKWRWGRNTDHGCYNDQDRVDEKTEGKMEDVSQPLVSFEISDKEQIEMIAV